MTEDLAVCRNFTLTSLAASFHHHPAAIRSSAAFSAAAAMDLIVLGAHGRTGLAYILLGSVADRVVHKARCPVLTVRHPEGKFKHPLDK